jgi:hypothetical protein
MVELEVPPRVVHELPVAWMIYGFDCDDLLYERRRVLTDVFDQLGLLVRRTGHQNHTRI